MEIAVPIVLSLMSGANALYSYLLSKQIKSDEEKIRQGGEQLNIILKEYDNHIKYVYKLQVLCNEYKHAFKDIYSTVFKNNEDIHKSSVPVINRYIIFEKEISDELKCKINDNINNINNIKNALKKSKIKYNKNQINEYKNLNENLLFLLYSICAIFAWLQIRKKDDNNLHASFSNENNKLQELINNFIDTLNFNDHNILIPINLQVSLGENLILDNKTKNENKDNYSIIDFLQFKNILKNKYLSDCNCKDVIEFKDIVNTDDQIIKTWGILKNSKTYNEWIAKEFNLINYINSHFLDYLIAFYDNSLKFKQVLLFPRRKKFNHGLELQTKKENEFLYVFLLYITILNIYEEDYFNINELKNIIVILVENLNKDKLVYIDNINVNIFSQKIKKLIVDWINFFRISIESKYDSEDIKKNWYEKKEIQFLKKIIELNKTCNNNTYVYDYLNNGKKYDLKIPTNDDIINQTSFDHKMKELFKNYLIDNSFLNNEYIESERYFWKIEKQKRENEKNKSMTDEEMKKEIINEFEKMINYGDSKLKNGIYLDKLTYYSLTNNSYQKRWFFMNDGMLIYRKSPEINYERIIDFRQGDFKIKLMKREIIIERENNFEIIKYDKETNIVKRKSITLKSDNQEDINNCYYYINEEILKRNTLTETYAKSCGLDLENYLILRKYFIENLNKINIKENINISDIDQEFIDTFLDLVHEFFMKYNHKFLENLNNICDDIFNETENIIKNDIKQRKNLLSEK